MFYHLNTTLLQKKIKLCWINVHISSHFSFQFQSVLELGEGCGLLQARKACKTTNNYIHVNSSSLERCSIACNEESKGTPGCCEYQVNRKKCIFVLGGTMLQTASTGGVVNRYATQCTYQGV